MTVFGEQHSCFIPALFCFVFHETIDIISNHLFANSVYFEGFDRSQFTKRLSLSVKNCHFIFNGWIYQPIDGMAMGSPLGPLFANIFMFSWLYNCPSSLNLLCIDVTLMIVFSSSDPQAMYLSFFPTLTANILTFPFHLDWKKTVNSLFLMSK